VTVPRNQSTFGSSYYTCSSIFGSRHTKTRFGQHALVETWRGYLSKALARPLAPDESLLRAGSRKITIRLLPLLLIGYLVSYIDRTNLGFAALTMNQAIGLTATQFGIAAGAFYVGYVLLEVPSNLVLQRVGARRWLARIMVTWGIAVAGTALARGPHSLYALRLLTGAAEAGFYPGVIFYLATWVPRKHRAKAFGWFNVANPLGFGDQRSTVGSASPHGWFLGYRRLAMALHTGRNTSLCARDLHVLRTAR